MRATLQFGKCVHDSYGFWYPLMRSARIFYVWWSSKNSIDSGINLLPYFSYGVITSLKYIFRKSFVCIFSMKYLDKLNWFFLQQWKIGNIYQANNTRVRCVNSTDMVFLSRYFFGHVPLKNSILLLCSAALCHLLTHPPPYHQYPGHTIILIQYTLVK